jgi:hypothetical protein
MARLDFRFSRPAGLPDGVWDERQRWLRAILWVHAVALSVLGAVRGESIATVAPYVLAMAVLAAATHLPLLDRRLQSAVVAAGLLCASVGLIALGDGAAAMWTHPFLVLALLMLYEDASLLLFAVAVVLATQVLSDDAGDPGAGYVLILGLAAAVGTFTAG